MGATGGGMGGMGGGAMEGMGGDMGDMGGAMGGMGSMGGGMRGMGGGMGGMVGGAMGGWSTAPKSALPELEQRLNSLLVTPVKLPLNDDMSVREALVSISKEIGLPVIFSPTSMSECWSESWIEATTRSFLSHLCSRWCFPMRT